MIRILTSTIICAFLIFVGTDANAQAANNIAQTEQDFAKDAKEHSFIYGFNKYAAPNAIWFNPDARKIQEDLLEMRKIPSMMEGAKLRWWPHHIGVSKSGDFGFDLGPWYIEGTEKSGFYFTIWNNIAPGIWAYSLDTGAGLVKNRNLLPQPNDLKPFQKVGKSMSKAGFISIENEINQKLETESASKLLPRFLLDGPIIAIEGKETDIGGANNSEHLKNLPMGKWKNNGFQFAVSGEMAASYGDVRDNNGKIMGEYIRLWFCENKFNSKPKIYVQIFRPRE